MAPRSGGPRLSQMQFGTEPVAGAGSPGSGFGASATGAGEKPRSVASAFRETAARAGVDLDDPNEPPATVDNAEEEALSVSEALGIAKGRLDGLPTLHVTGEVTGFRGPNARSGHCYFQVKDDSSAMDVIVWRGIYEASGIELRDGLLLQMSGKFDVYLGSGRMSFIARKIALAGEGLLRQQVAQLARKLEREGLMAPERKRPIPRFCTRAAVVTSLSGSVIDDVKRTLRRRNPLVELQVVGAQVQGPGAPESIMSALVTAAKARPDCILLVRGGGSFEDLMTFNDEALARAVAGCPVPVVTGIGHEPDTCICDMVADRRASTPTAAAESVAPAIDEIAATIDARAQRLAIATDGMLAARGSELAAHARRLGDVMNGRLGRERVAVETLARHRCLAEPTAFLELKETQLLQSEQRLHDAGPRAVERASDATDALQASLVGLSARMLRGYEQTLARSASTLDALSPLKVLGRGYAIAQDDAGHVVSSVEQVSAGDALNIKVNDGVISTTVTAGGLGASAPNPVSS